MPASKLGNVMLGEKRELDILGYEYRTVNIPSEDRQQILRASNEQLLLKANTELHRYSDTIRNNKKL